SEWRAEPGDPRVGILSVRRLAGEHPQVGRRPAHPLVEPFARGLDARVIEAGAIERIAGVLHRVRIGAPGHAAVLAFAADGERERGRRLWRQVVLEAREA